MTNDPRDLSGARLQNALQLIGKNPNIRAEIISLLKKWNLRSFIQALQSVMILLVLLSMPCTRITDCP